MKKVVYLASLMTLSNPVWAATLIVDPSDAAAYQTIQAAIDAASNGDTIEVAYNLYTGQGDSVINTAGKAITIRAPLGATIWGAGQRTCISCTSGETAATIIDGFVLHQGHGGSGNNARGGGIHLVNSSPTVQNCDIANCFSTYGGAVRAQNSNATFDNCEISENSAFAGAGLYLDDFNGSINDCTIEDNQAGGRGGGLAFIGSSNGSMTCCAITNNTATNWNAQGGGIFVASADPAIHNCAISSNSVGSENAENSEGKGGGLFIDTLSSAMLVSCVIDNNHAVQGGGVYTDNSTPSLQFCSIHNNTGDAGGGVFVHNSGAMSLEGCTIWQNTSDDGPGGGVHCANSAPNISQCTINDNSSLIEGGGGVYLSGSTASIEYCQIMGNQSCCGGGILCENQDDSIITGCFIEGNHASINGGGAQCAGPVTTTFVQCDFQNNTAAGSYAALDAGQDIAGPELSGNEFCENGVDGIGGILNVSDINARADIDGTNGVDTDDLLLLVSNWSNVNNIATVDVDLDGLLTVQDLLAILQHWGDCHSEFMAVEYLTASIDNGNDLLPPIEIDVDPESWSAEVNFPEYTSMISVDQIGGNMSALYGTSQATWPILRTTIRLTRATTLQIDGFAQIHSATGTRFSVSRLSECGNETVESINIGNAIDGADYFSGSIDDLPPGNYELKLSAFLSPNGSVGSGIGVTWTYE
ncbi:MAG: right-handed parallel beta-helix repeat-containing protein [Phycisphaerales bacterium]|nr:right-handed parallel beta-helix repeat-containing protein [Phycisphaerales bacterium]